MAEFVKDAYCGLYCAACPLYMATEDGTAGDLKCHGCKSEQVAPGWCSSCSLKACAIGKGYASCAECAERPCPELQAFTDDKTYQYHIEVGAYLDTVKAKGKAAWLAEMAMRWSCPSCGKSSNWYEMKCASCGTALKGYPKMA